MSSRPATPKEDITAPQQTDTIRRTRSQTRQSQVPNTRREMLATVQYHGHNPYAHPPPHHHHHPLQDFARQGQPPPVTTQPRELFAQPVFTFNTPYDASAGTAAPLAITSGGLEGRSENADNVKTRAQKRGHTTNLDTGMHRRRSPSLERPQTSTGNEATAENPIAPQKKKRTRTLTTSNQSSVLLALLAKTPFPTTAEREEVGRAIGLTARKVQVWFQNQRQKQKKSTQMGSSTIPPTGGTTSAPLPLSSQPGFSALHAARMGYHDQTGPSFPSSNIAPYPSGGSSRESGQPGHYDPSSPSRGQNQESYQAGTAYSRSFPNESTYYPIRSTTTAESDQYPPAAQPITSASGHSFPPPPSSLPQQTYITGDFSDPFSHRQAHSREPSSHSFAYPPASQDPLSDDQSRPTTSRGPQPYRPTSSDSWTSKPLPPLPSDVGHGPGGQPLSWEHTASDQNFRAPTFPSRARAFSNPDPAAEGYGPIRPFAPVPATAGGLTPSTAFAATHFFSAPAPSESVAPSSYHGPSEYHSEEGQRIRHGASGSIGDQYSFRYADQFPSPGGVSSSSSLSYSEATGMGLSSSSQHPPNSISYSPLEQRRSRLSYDSSLAAGSQVLGKRSWSADDGRATKRARTDDGHTALPPRPGTRTLPPTAYQPRTAGPSLHGTQEVHIAPGVHSLPPRSEEGQHPYHYQAPSDPTSGI